MPLASSLERMNASIGLLTQLVFVTSGGFTAVTGVNGQHGVALVDESEGAREYLANHPYAPALEKWQKSHPYLRDHPERTHQWMRRRNEVEIGHALRGGVPASVQAPADEQADRGGSERGGSSS